MSQKRITVGCLGLICTLFSAAISAHGTQEHPDQGAGLSTMAAEQGFPPVDCIIGPHQVIDLSSAVPGVIDKVYKERSEFVEQDQVVAELASDVEKAAVKLAKARSEIESEVQVGQVNMVFAQRQQERIDSLFGKKAVSYQNKDEADREMELSRWQLQQARDLVNIRNLELNRARAELKQKTVRSPITGFVVKSFKSVGEYVEDQPIMRIAQLDPLNVEAIVPMELFGRVKPGMTAVVQLEALNFAPQEAEVVLVDRVGDAGSGTFGVRLSLPNPDYKIPAGLKCDLRFRSDTRSTADQFSPDIESLKERSNTDRGKQLVSAVHLN